MTRDYAKANRPRPRQRNSRVKPSRKSAPGWVWMVAGVLIGVLATTVLQHGDSPPPQPPVADSGPDTTSPAATEEPAPAPTHKPRFDFYTLLKETEVIVPEQDGSQPPRTVVVTAAEDSTAPRLPPPSTGTDPATATGTTAQTASRPPATAPAEPTPAPPAPPATAPVATPEPPQETAAVPPPASSQPREVYVLQAGSFRLASDADSVRARLLLLNLQASVERVTTANNETWHRVLIGPFASQTESARVRATLTQNGIESIQLKRQL